MSKKVGRLKCDNLKEGGRSGPKPAILFQSRASFIAKKCDLSFPETKELGSLRVCFCEKGRLCGGVGVCVSKTKQKTENGRTTET